MICPGMMCGCVGCCWSGAVGICDCGGDRVVVFGEWEWGDVGVFLLVYRIVESIYLLCLAVSREYRLVDQTLRE